jgi:ankyrin repeat protein
MDLFEAARTGDLDALDICLFWGERVDRRTRDGRTPLCIAAERGQTEAVRRLLARNADPNAHAPGASRPLTAAIENEHWETAAVLVRGGADPNADGVASIVIAEPPKRRLLALMLSRGLDPHGAHAEWGPYVLFALNDAACWDMFLGAGFDLARYERETGESLLERALSNGVSRFLHLLSLGANVDLPVERATGRTMLMTLAAEEPGEQAHAVIELLVKRGADLEQCDASGRTAFDYAADRDDKRTVTLLTRLRDNVRRARERERKRLAQAEARAQAAAAAKADRERKAAAKKAAAAEKAAAAAERRAAKKPAKPKPKQRAAPAPRAKQVKRAAPVKRVKRRRAPGKERSESRGAKPIEKPARSEATPTAAEKLHPA